MRLCCRHISFCMTGKALLYIYSTTNVMFPIVQLEYVNIVPHEAKIMNLCKIKRRTSSAEARQV